MGILRESRYAFAIECQFNELHLCEYYYKSVNITISNQVSSYLLYLNTIRKSVNIIISSQVSSNLHNVNTITKSVNVIIWSQVSSYPLYMITKSVNPKLKTNKNI